MHLFSVAKICFLKETDLKQKSRTLFVVIVLIYLSIVFLYFSTIYYFKFINDEFNVFENRRIKTIMITATKFEI